MCARFIHAYSGVQIYYVTSTLDSKNYLYLTWDTNDSKSQIEKMFSFIYLVIQLIIFINDVANKFEMKVTF